MKQKVRAIYISDLHIGSKDSKCEKLLEFLNFYDYDELYLLGDIIDGYLLKQRIYWNEHYSSFIKTILELSKTKKIVYVPGNHDEFMRGFDGMKIGNLSIQDSVVIDRNTYKVMVIHGDQFDHGLIHGTGLYKFGSFIYHALQSIDRFFKKLIPKFSLSRPAKFVTKKCTTHVSNYKSRAVTHAEIHGCDTVITGHVHIPESKIIGSAVYLNCGDWLDNLTAVIETHYNAFEIVKYSDIKERRCQKQTSK